MTKSKNSPMRMDTNERQREYIASQRANGVTPSIVFPDAFLRGIRDLGYKDPAWSVAEMVDNSIQAAAKRIGVLFGFAPGNRSQKKPDHLAIVDDGAGMIPEMITFAVAWGGTDRADDRSGFGRYGYGLPSSAVSLACRYTVYSKAQNGDWHAVTVDIEQLARAGSDSKKTATLLGAKPAEVPSWVIESSKEIDLSSIDSGTVVVLEDLDRLRRLGGWIKIASLKQKLLQSLGVIYRHWLPQVQVWVGDGLVEPVDPLFLMDYGRYYADNSVRAKRIDAKIFEMEATDGCKGVVSIRASVLPPTFQRPNPDDPSSVTKKMLRGRWDVMRKFNGLLICREGRQIDCVNPRWTKFQNYDANIKIEIDFDPVLDEYFGITTSKQQITIDDDVWDRLENPGKNGGALRNLVYDMREEFRQLQIQQKSAAENAAGEDKPLPAEVAMETSEKFVKARKEDSPSKREQAQAALEETAESVAKTTGKPKEEVIEELIASTSDRRWKVECRSVEEGPFYKPKRIGEQKRVILNTEHPFYGRVYSAITAETQAAVQVLLFVLAEAELEAEGEQEQFYKAARHKWSERLRFALEQLQSDASMADKAAAVAEELHVAMTDE